MSGNKFQWKLNSRRIVLDHDHIYDIIIYRWVAQFCWRGKERRGERDARRLRIKGRPCVYSYHYNVKIKSTILYWVVCKVFGTYQYHAFNRRAYLLLNFCRIIEFWFQVNFTRKKIEFKFEFLSILMILKIIVIVKNNSLILEKIYIYVYIYKKKNNDDKTFINYLN